MLETVDNKKKYIIYTTNLDCDFCPICHKRMTKEIEMIPYHQYSEKRCYGYSCGEHFFCKDIKQVKDIEKNSFYKDNIKVKWNYYISNKIYLRIAENSYRTDNNIMSYHILKYGKDYITVFITKGETDKKGNEYKLNYHSKEAADFINFVSKLEDRDTSINKYRVVRYAYKKQIYKKHTSFQIDIIEYKLDRGKLYSYDDNIISYHLLMKREPQGTKEDYIAVYITKDESSHKDDIYKLNYRSEDAVRFMNFILDPYRTEKQWIISESSYKQLFYKESDVNLIDINEYLYYNDSVYFYVTIEKDEKEESLFIGDKKNIDFSLVPTVNYSDENARKLITDYLYYNAKPEKYDGFKILKLVCNNVEPDVIRDSLNLREYLVKTDDTYFKNVLFFSPKTRQYECIRTLWDKKGRVFISPSIFREFVANYGNPQVELIDGKSMYDEDEFDKDEDSFDFFEDFSFERDFFDYDIDYEEDKYESGKSCYILTFFGYNVKASGTNNRSALSDHERQEIIKYILDLRLQTKKNIIDHFTYLINRDHNPRLAQAKAKWARDIEFTESYIPNPSKYLNYD